MTTARHLPSSITGNASSQSKACARVLWYHTWPTEALKRVAAQPNRSVHPLSRQTAPQTETSFPCLTIIKYWSTRNHFERVKTSRLPALPFSDASCPVPRAHQYVFLVFVVVPSCFIIMFAYLPCLTRSECDCLCRVCVLS